MPFNSKKKTCLKNYIILKTWPIQVEMISNLNSLCRNDSKFCLNVFSDIEVAFTKKEKVFKLCLITKRS